MNRPSALKILLILAVSWLVGLTPGAWAGGVPALIHYQGTLAGPTGTPVPDGDYAVAFAIYDVPTAGTPLWTEGWNASTVPVRTFGGNFAVLLGSHQAIPEAFFNDNPETYLGVKVGADPEMQPRQRIASVAYALKSGDGVPSGAIIMWSGSLDTIPAGWALCDGSNGTPNLMSRFIVGAGSGYSVGAIGGEATHVLTVAELPSHSHPLTDPGHSHRYKKPNMVGGFVEFTSAPISVRVDPMDEQQTFTSQTGISIGSTGSGNAHENRPPYYALAFIMKL